MDITGKVTSWLVIGLGAGNMFFPWFIGQLFEPVGEIMLPVINLITFLVALLLILIIFRYLFAISLPPFACFNFVERTIISVAKFMKDFYISEMVCG